ncbi:hypothetical protein I552_8297 [Mycobacterium xenopi 3993]|nr:hypothetical protein I552_8297 [Mycobacterium xenopi 3993]
MAQHEDPEDYVAPAAQRVRSGTLLLANTDLLEPTFRRSVIYVVEHNDGGTLGVVLNRPATPPSTTCCRNGRNWRPNRRRCSSGTGEA